MNLCLSVGLWVHSFQTLVVFIALKIITQNVKGNEYLFPSLLYRDIIDHVESLDDNYTCIEV